MQFAVRCRVDSSCHTCYKVIQVKRSVDTTHVSRASGAVSLPARFSYFWRFS